MKKKFILLILLKILILCLLSSCYVKNKTSVFPYRFQNKYGLMNENFKVIVKAEYDRLIFKEKSNYFIGIRNSRWVILNNHGKCVYESSTPITHIYEDFFSVSDKNGEYLISVKDRNIRIPAYKFIQSYQPLIPCKKKDLYEYIDLKGVTVFEKQFFRRSYGFNEGRSVNITSDWDWAVVDESGNYLFGKEFDYLGQKFSEGLLYAKDKKGTTGYVDSGGKFRITIKTIPFTEDAAAASNFYNDAAVINTAENGFCVINKKGDFIKKNLSISNFYEFCDGLALVVISNNKKDLLYNYINTSGNFLFKENFEYAQNFHNGWAVVSKDGKDAIINKAGEIIFLDSFMN